MRTYRCNYCGCKLVEDWRGNCKSCGAPAPDKLEYSNVTVPYAAQVYAGTCAMVLPSDFAGTWRGQPTYYGGQGFIEIADGDDENL